MTTLDKVRGVISLELAVPFDEIKPNSSFVSLGADSLDMASLVNALEEELGTEIPDDDLPKLPTVQDVCNYIDSHRVTV